MNKNKQAQDDNMRRTLLALRKAGRCSPQQLAGILKVNRMSVKRALWYAWQRGYVAVQPNVRVGEMLFSIEATGELFVDSYNVPSAEKPKGRIVRLLSAVSTPKYKTQFAGDNPFAQLLRDA